MDIFANGSIRRAVTAFAVLLGVGWGTSASSETCNGGLDQAGDFFLIQDPGPLTRGVPAQVGIRVTNGGQTTWYGEGNDPYPFRLGVGSDSDLAGDVVWSGWSCGGYSNPADPLKDQRAFMCNNSTTPRAVAPGETVDFYFNVSVPTTFQNPQAALRMRMVYDAGQTCDGWFGSQVVQNLNVTIPTCPNTPLSTPSDRWRLQIYDGRDPNSGALPVEVRYDFPGDNGFTIPVTGPPNVPPSNCVGPTDYSIRFTRFATFTDSATYQFDYKADDGIRIYIDNSVVIDRWADPQSISDSFTRFMAAGSHPIVVEYYQATGDAQVSLSWANTTPPPPPIPPAPTGLAATGGQNQILLGWTASTGIGVTRYNVYRRPPGGTFEVINCAFSNATHCADNGLPDSTEFCYVTTAVNPTGESDPSNEACAQTNAPPPPTCPNTPLDIPSDQWLLEIYNAKGDLSGTPVERRYQFPGDDGFDFEAGPGISPSDCTTDQNYSIRFTRLANFPTDGTYDFTYVADDGFRLYIDDVLIVERWGDPQVVNGTMPRSLTAGEHKIQVDYYQAMGGAQASLTWTLEPAPTKPPAPTGLTATGATNAVQLGWDQSLDPTVNSYNVKRRTPPSTTFNPIGCNFTDPVHCTDVLVVPGTSYCYVVTAYNNQGEESDDSNEACATPTAAPQPSIQLSVSDATGTPLADGTTLTTTSDGWPTPNGLVVTATVNCPATLAGGCHGNGVLLELHYTGQSARFWIESHGDPLCRQIDNTTVSDYSLSQALWLCDNAPVPGLDLNPGQTRQFVYSLMVQPNATADMLQLTGTWGAASDQFAIGNPATQVHPLVLVPGVLGTMPPSPVIGQLDPVLGVYNPMQVQLQKMGYVMNQTLFPMPYDWRRSNRESAGHLRDRLDSAFAAAKNVPVATADGKADLVVHSMGGLVARTYVEGLGVDPTTLVPIAYRNDVRKVLFIATPHRGFPEDYRTYEGSTWDMYLYDDTLPGFAMDNVFWPAFVEKRWVKRHTAFKDYLPFPTGHPFAGRVMCLFGPLDCTGFFSPTLEYRMTHDLTGGTDSLRQMLPTDDADTFFGPYLCHNAAGGACSAGPYPFGKQTNPLLNPPLLNDAANLGALGARLGPGNIFVIYGRDPDRPQDLVDVAYDVGPPTSALGTTMFQNGTPKLAQRDSAGDDLIPDYSMDLRLLLPSIPAGNVAGTAGPGGTVFGLPGDAARHKQILYNPDVLNFWLPRYVAGLDRLALRTNYVKPTFTLDPHQWWSLAALCPVNLTVTDPQGRRAGYNPDTGGVFREIPGAVYAAPNSPDGQFLILPDPMGGDYNIRAAGFDKDSFSLVLSQITGKGVFRRWSTGGQTVAGQVDTFTVHFDPSTPAAQHPPVANAGPDITVAAGPNCTATVTLDGSRSTDADGEDLIYIWTGAALGSGAVVGVNPTVTLPVGANTLTLLVQDGSRVSSTDTVVVTVTAPAPNITSLVASPSVLNRPDGKFVEVKVTPTVPPGCSGVAACKIVAVTSDEPVGPGGDWNITGPLTVNLRAKRDRGKDGRVYTITVECRYGNGPASRRMVTVTVPPAGRMTGVGEIEGQGNIDYEYSFDVSESERGVEGGQLHFEVEREGRHCHHNEDELRSIEITSVVFSNDPSINPGGGVPVDTVQFSGRGRWNGRDGYTFDVTATDAGEPGPGRDRFKIVVRDRSGNVVASVDHTIDEGNNQSKTAPY